MGDQAKRSGKRAYPITNVDIPRTKKTMPPTEWSTTARYKPAAAKTRARTITSMFAGFRLIRTRSDSAP